ncbi:MAG: hypothetical protein GF308_05675 [Candidatus Heimdallarchaeota archaeon]|nr:hypothetical protein [Candidatus Heimdallarchaeota archaeon]
MQIKIQTPCRLHFSLIDLNGNLGRINGGIGVALDEPGWIIQGFDQTIENDRNFPISKKALAGIRKFDRYFGTDSQNFSFQILESIPAHVGLGSHTQFLLAIGLMLTRFHGISASIREIAKAVERGGTSGIGVAAFEAGGIIVDGGHSFGPGKQKESFLPSSVSKAPPPPVIFRNYPPKNWKFIVFRPNIRKGASGSEEVNLFKTECPIPEEDVEKLSRLILMKILPAIVERDIITFGEGLNELQTKFQRFGFERYGDFIEDLLEQLRRTNHVFGAGISSFGPTIFALTDSKAHALETIEKITENYQENDFNSITFSSVNSGGAKMKVRKNRKKT